MANRNKAHTITCADCGWPTVTVRSNTKYCNICRLSRAMMFLKKSTNKCWVCDQKFAPLERGDVLCGSCDTTKRMLADHGECKLCGDPDAVLLRDLAACYACASKPEHRPQLVRNVRIKATNRAATEPDQGYLDKIEEQLAELSPRKKAGALAGDVEDL